MLDTLLDDIQDYIYIHIYMYITYTAKYTTLLHEVTTQCCMYVVINNLAYLIKYGFRPPSPTPRWSRSPRGRGGVDWVGWGESILNEL